MNKIFPICSALLLCSVFITGCVTPKVVTPTRSVDVHPYRGNVSFLASDPAVGRNVVHQVQGRSQNKSLAVAMKLSVPGTGIMSFTKSEPAPGRFSPQHLELRTGDPADLLLSTGVYPFDLRNSVDSSPVLSGLFLVYNLSEDAQFVTLGADPEGDRILDPALIREVRREGKLVRFTMTMDGAPILTYFLGNRPEVDLKPRGQTTALVDFSEVPGITELIVNGVKQDSYDVTLPIYRQERDANRVYQDVLNQYRFRMTAGGREYEGIIRMRGDALETRFTRLVCAFPEELMTNAAAGALSRFTLNTQKEDLPLLEISFGLAR
jgi:hypothetical protein